MTDDVFQDARRAMAAAKADLDAKRKAYFDAVRSYYGLRGWGGLVERVGPKVLQILTAGGLGAGLTQAIEPVRAALGL